MEGLENPSSVAAFVRSHPATTAEVKALCGDLQVLGRSEFKQLLKWWALFPTFSVPATRGLYGRSECSSFCDCMSISARLWHTISLTSNSLEILGSVPAMYLGCI